MPVQINITIFWYVILQSSVDRYQRSTDTTLVFIKRTTRHHIPGDPKLSPGICVQGLRKATHS
jgi:hypothetical protein